MKASASEPAGATRLMLLGDARQVHLKRWADYFARSGYEILTLSLEAYGEFPTPIKKPPLPSALPDFARYPLSIPFVRRTMARFRPDIINAHFVPNYGMIAAMINKPPWILSAWGSDIMLLPQKSFFHRWRTRFVLERATFITSDAKVMSNRLVALGCDPGCILTIPYGVDLDLFHPADGKALTEASKAAGPRILSNRKLEKVYNIETIIAAFSLVRKTLTEARLTIAGEGSLRRSLRQRANGSGYGDDILFIAGMEHEKVPSLLREHDIFVSMSLSDTTSVSLLEAMACGIFPIVSDIPANREWIKDGENGLLVPPRDREALAAAIQKAWSNKPLLARASAVNREIIKEKADWRKNMHAVNDLFERALEKAAK